MAARVVAIAVAAAAATAVHRERACPYERSSLLVTDTHNPNLINHTSLSPMVMAMAVVVAVMECTASIQLMRMCPFHPHYLHDHPLPSLRIPTFLPLPITHSSLPPHLLSRLMQLPPPDKACVLRVDRSHSFTLIPTPPHPLHLLHHQSSHVH